MINLDGDWELQVPSSEVELSPSSITPPAGGGASHSEGLRRLAVVGPSPAAVCVEETGMTRMVCVLLVGVAAVAARTVTAVGREP